ncbi:hypothetical protein AU152_gp75 [Mycobacterium phage Phlei]|uniref:Uncharacterized protein n=1 Tax=Mycobacterium phage Phlei TaxID=1690684 RepID=A0A0N9BDT3_9CAUD|nr:hypothetical protein AU152_gp75 [Mycobacterium phage Phlei]ALA48188.1 hypothetical protein [Mycobacterium phage Phlei]
MDSSSIILSALEDAIYDAIEKGLLTESVWDNAPQSQVFYPSEGEYWDEDDMAVIRWVGQQDVNNKISYYRRVLDNL